MGVKVWLHFRYANVKRNITKLEVLSSNMDLTPGNLDSVFASEEKLQLFILRIGQI